MSVDRALPRQGRALPVGRESGGRVVKVLLMTVRSELVPEIHSPTSCDLVPMPVKSVSLTTTWLLSA